jgi:hypothetical protein
MSTVGFSRLEVKIFIDRLNAARIDERCALVIDEFQDILERIVDTVGFSPLLYPSSPHSAVSFDSGLSSAPAKSIHRAGAAIDATAARSAAAGSYLDPELPAIRTRAAGATIAPTAALAAEAADNSKEQSNLRAQADSLKMLENMLNARAKPTVHPPRDKIGGTGNVCAKVATATTARWLRLLNPRHERYRHRCHMQPIMHRMQPILFSILHTPDWHL